MAFNLGASVKIAAQVTGQQAVDQLRGSLGQLNKTTDVIRGGVTRLSGAVTALATAFAAGAGINYFRELLNAADDLRDLSQKVGIGVEALSKLDTAAKLNGSSLESLSGGLKKFSVGVSEATRDGGKAGSAFAALGINIKNARGELRPTEELLFDVADRFQTLRDGPDKAAIAVRLFGKAGADLIPILNQGSEELRKYGLNFTQDFADRADQFNDSLTLLNNTVKNFAIEGLGVLLPTIQEIVNAISTITVEGKAATSTFQLIADGLRGVAIVANGFIQGLLTGLDFVVKAATQVLDLVNTIASSLRKTVQLDFSGATAEYEAFFDRANKRADEFFKGAAARGKQIQDFTSALAKNLGDPEGARRDTAPAESARGQARANTSALDEESTKSLQSAAKATQDRIAAIQAETAALGKSEKQKRIILELAELERRGIEKNTFLYELYKQQIEAVIEAQERRKEELAANPLEGARVALEAYIKSVNDLATQTGNLVTNTLKGLEDAFVDFFTTGTADWRAFANSIIAEITRIAVRKAIIAPIAGGLTSLFGFADRGIMTPQGPMPLQSYAKGGIADRPQLALFGEGSMNEAFVPLPDGKRIPVALQGAGSGGVGSVTVNVSVEGGTQSVASNDQAGQLGKAIASAVQAELVKQKRPGGLLA